MLPREFFNSHLDKLVRPQVYLFHRPWPAFQVCGYTGLALAILLAMSLVTSLGLSPLVMAAIILSAVLTFLGLAMATKIVTGEENLVYYHHEIAVVTVTAVLLWLLRQPILPYLDATILGVGLFLACGRIGCLMVGCCHGRPYRWGVRYRAEHAAAGFTPYYVGIRLFPIQAVESLWVLFIVCVGSLMILTGQPPGSALAWYIVTYDLGRFFFEFMRGDPERPYLWGFSEAQWISFVLVCVVVAAELSGFIAFQSWHIGAMAGLGLTMIGVALHRRFQKTARYQLLHPHHVKQVAQAIELVSERKPDVPSKVPWTIMPPRHFNSAGVRAAQTFLGIQISASQTRSGVNCIYHYALSNRNGSMTEETARVLADLILLLKGMPDSSELVRGNRGVFHLLIRPS